MHSVTAIADWNEFSNDIIVRSVQNGHAKNAWIIWFVYTMFRAVNINSYVAYISAIWCETVN